MKSLIVYYSVDKKIEMKEIQVNDVNVLIVLGIVPVRELEWK